jgi:purine-cytosine permease-like protein
MGLSQKNKKGKGKRKTPTVWRAVSVIGLCCAVLLTVAFMQKPQN